MPMPVELRPGLWRWSASHPDWHATEDDGSPTAWPREVGCLLYTTPSSAVFIDPLAPAEGSAAFWRWADELCRDREVSCLETIAYHRRSREEVTARYAASTDVPAGAAAHPLPGFGETVYWIPEHRALVPGDSLIAAPGGELRLCPQSWLDDLRSPGQAPPTQPDLRAALLPLCDLDPELVLVSHGEPAVHGAGAALARALALAAT
jgi:hypothetical protein